MGKLHGSQLVHLEKRQFQVLASEKPKKDSFRSYVREVCGYILWVLHDVFGGDYVIFNTFCITGDQVEVDRVVELSQFKTWLWCKANVTGFMPSIFEWSSNLICCLESL